MEIYLTHWRRFNFAITRITHRPQPEYIGDKSSTLPYFGKRKQVTQVTFLVKEQNVSIISTDVNGIS